MMTYAKHQLDIYPVEIHLATDAKSWKKARRELGLSEKKSPRCVGQTTFCHNAKGAPAAHLIWIADTEKKFRTSLVDTIAHEAFHASEDIMEWIGYEKGGEPTAYLIGWITGWIYQQMMGE